MSRSSQVEQYRRSPVASRKAAAVVAAVASLTTGLVCARPAVADPGPAVNGRIAFFRHNHAYKEASHIETIAPGDVVARRLGDLTGAHPRWSPDGTEIAIDAQIDMPTQPSAVILDARTGAVRELTGTLGKVCYTWSPDGSRLACNGDGLNGDTSIDPGITTIRSSDGGGLQRVTDFVSMPGDYSPDGQWLSLVGDVGDGPRIFEVRLDGCGLLPLTPIGMPGLNDEVGGNWSPDGSQIIFQAKVDADHRASLWSVHPDGSDLRQITVTGCGGLREDPYSIACFDPAWSPDGRQIVFDRFDAHTGRRNVYTVNADGTGLRQVTNTGNVDEAPDWGVQPAVP
jgi:Tol biopolymer transport system component